ncbi:ATP-binding protein [Aliiglaciecola lipolytica]|uniref:histidine kinase n=1 Tax=Aliiglaciecola lipolytica E3 TaxID=1127673 RepID=K6YD01_9ALTE|nr:ATP-binding protein [Aliiglaciecola lipolytica]GAC16082.1 two-component system, OmpR family, sensor histidine kinase CpxA [Aliiglaciecola lipolytica E3]
MLLKKLNPINSLFGRTFLWFWLAAILLGLTGAWLANQTSANYSIKPLEEKYVKRLQQVAARVEATAQRFPNADLDRLLGRAGQRSKDALLLIDQQTQKFIYGFPREMKPYEAPFIELLGESQIYMIHTSTGMFYGPAKVNINNRNYLLFAGKPRPPKLIRQLIQTNPVALTLSVILVSGSLCALFVWSLLRPIRELQKSTRKVAMGDLTQSVDFASKRGDEIGELGKDFNAMTQRLATLMGSQKRLVADISHELRSPLARLQLAIGIAQSQQEPLPEAIEKQLLRIEKEAHEIDGMIGQVLKLSRLEADVEVENKQRIELRSCLNGLFNDAAFEAQNKGKKLLLDEIPPLTLNCYPQLLKSAIGNVISNGIKYSSTKVEVSFTVHESTMEVKIKDDGSGVPETDLEDMFKPFYRLSASRNRDTGGVGLGLAIVKQAIKLHEGSVIASNSAEGGLIVSITIPTKG